MIHPQPTTVLLLLSESGRVQRRPDDTEPLIAAAARTRSAKWRERVLGVLIGWRRQRRPAASVRSSPELRSLRPPAGQCPQVTAARFRGGH